jgi:hypothetical protein
MKDKANSGFIKQLASKATQSTPKKTFDYKKPVNKLDKPVNMAVNSRSREYKSVKPDKTSNLKTEQTSARASKGYK